MTDPFEILRAQLVRAARRVVVEPVAPSQRGPRSWRRGRPPATGGARGRAGDLRLGDGRGALTRRPCVAATERSGPWARSDRSAQGCV